MTLEEAQQRTTGGSLITMSGPVNGYIQVEVDKETLSADAINAYLHWLKVRQVVTQVEALVISSNNAFSLRERVLNIPQEAS